MDAGGVDILTSRHRDGLLLGLLLTRWAAGVLDPVENASLMPVAQVRLLIRRRDGERNALNVWTSCFQSDVLAVLLAPSGALGCLTRACFATDPTRGVFILLILASHRRQPDLYAWRASALKQGGLFAPISREGAWCQQSVPHHRCAEGVIERCTRWRWRS